MLYNIYYMRISKNDRAFQILKEYNGGNPYLLELKRDVYVNGKVNIITEKTIDYILNNHSFKPKVINKMTTLADWYAQEKQEEWGAEFPPIKIKIISLLGETQSAYHCYIQYRQSVPPLLVFLPKKAVIKNFLVDDYHNLEVDFQRYDNLSMEKDPNRKIKEEQKEAVQFLLSRKKCILADDMGYGKTLELSIAAIEGNFDSVLIICPASIKTNWKKELSWYVDEKNISIVDSFIYKTKPELETFLGFAEGRSNMSRTELLEMAKTGGKWQNNRFVIVNYDILDEFYTIINARSEDNIRKEAEKSPILKYIMNRKSLIIIDEAHRLSNNTSTRYKIIKNLIKIGKPHSIYLATGTPVTNNPKNLFCLLQLLDDPIKNEWEYYMNRYCGAMKIPAKGEKERCTRIFLKKVGKPDWYSLSAKEKLDLKEFIDKNAVKITIANGATNLGELKDKISHIYLRRVKEDMDKMPNKTIHEAVYDLTPEQKEEYDRLWEEYEAEKKEENPDVEINRELLEGAVYRKYISNIMVPYTIRIVDHWLKRGEKVVIACCYDEELYTLNEHYGDKSVIYNGKMNSKQKDKAVDEFMNNPNVTVFIGNIVAAGVGITLTSSNKLVFNNMSFVPGDCQQMQDRICRIGQTKDCDIYYQYFRDTQYEHIWNTVLKKSLVIDQVIKKESEK